MRLPLGRWLVTGIVSLCSTGALAADTKTPFPPCTTAPTEADRKAAQGAFAAGQGSFNEADYATAITYWRDAYRRDCTAHALLLNLARAYELKTDRSEAVNALETYLQRKPDAPDVDQIRRRIDNLKSQMAAAAPQPLAPVAPPPTAAPVAATPLAPEGADKGHGAGIAPFVIVGAGGVAAIVGAVVLAGGAKKVSNAEEVCGARACPQPISPPERPPSQRATTGGTRRRSAASCSASVSPRWRAGSSGTSSRSRAAPRRRPWRRAVARVSLRPRAELRRPVARPAASSAQAGRRWCAPQRGSRRTGLAAARQRCARPSSHAVRRALVHSYWGRPRRPAHWSPQVRQRHLAGRQLRGSFTPKHKKTPQNTERRSARCSDERRERKTCRRSGAPVRLTSSSGRRLLGGSLRLLGRRRRLCSRSGRRRRGRRLCRGGGRGAQPRALQPVRAAFPPWGKPKPKQQRSDQPAAASHSTHHRKPRWQWQLLAARRAQLISR